MRKRHKHSWRLAEVSEGGMRIMEVCRAHLFRVERVTLHPKLAGQLERIINEQSRAGKERRPGDQEK